MMSNTLSLSKGYPLGTRLLECQDSPDRESGIGPRRSWKVIANIQLPWFSQAVLAELVLCLVVSAPSLLAAQVRQEVHETYAFKPTGAIRIDNINGRIHLTGWNRSEIQLDAIKKGRSQEDLDRVILEIDARPDRLVIRTEHLEEKTGWLSLGRPKNVSASVDYILMVPHSARLEHVATVNGSLVIENVLGAVNASSVNGGITAKSLANPSRFSTVNGSIEAQYDRFETSGPSTLATVNGTIVLRVPEQIDAYVFANTVNGSINTDLPLVVKKSLAGGKNLRGTLGAGGARIKVNTVNGGIKIRKTEFKPAKQAVPVER